MFAFKEQLSSNEKNTHQTTKEESEVENNSTSLKEVDLIIKKAKQLASQGKREKARKLFEHVLSLKPKHVFALNSYGEFLEGDNQFYVLHIYLLLSFYEFSNV